jgi:hypothetical protein
VRGRVERRPRLDDAQVLVVPVKRLRVEALPDAVHDLGVARVQPRREGQAADRGEDGGLQLLCGVGLAADVVDVVLGGRCAEARVLLDEALDGHFYSNLVGR